MKSKSALLFLLLLTSQIIPSVSVAQTPLREKIAILGSLALATMGGGYLSYKCYQGWRQQLDSFDKFRRLLENMGVRVTDETDVEWYGNVTLYNYHLRIEPTRYFTQSEKEKFETYAHGLRDAWHKQRTLFDAFSFTIGLNVAIGLIAFIMGYDVIAEK